VIVGYWHGWAHWLFGFQWFSRRRPQCWVFRWIVALGPYDIRWRIRP
jgi:hypothetical protein